MNYALNYIIAKEEMEKRFRRLTKWQKFIICLYLLGWKPVEIAKVVGISRQGITFTINETKKRMGVYWSTL